MSEPSSRLARDRLHVNGSDLATKLLSLLAVTVGMLFIIFMFLERALERVVVANENLQCCVTFNKKVMINE